MSSRDCGLAPFEIEHGFDKGGTQKRTQTLLTRKQWMERGREVFVINKFAEQTVTNKNNGHVVSLFSFDQTTEYVPEKS